MLFSSISFSQKCIDTVSIETFFDDLKVVNDKYGTENFDTIIEFYDKTYSTSVRDFGCFKIYSQKRPYEKKEGYFFSLLDGLIVEKNNLQLYFLTSGSTDPLESVRVVLLDDKSRLKKAIHLKNGKMIGISTFCYINKTHVVENFVLTASEYRRFSKFNLFQLFEEEFYDRIMELYKSSNHSILSINEISKYKNFCYLN